MNESNLEKRVPKTFIVAVFQISKRQPVLRKLGMGATEREARVEANRKYDRRSKNPVLLYRYDGNNKQIGTATNIILGR